MMTLGDYQQPSVEGRPSVIVLPQVTLEELNSWHITTLYHQGKFSGLDSDGAHGHISAFLEFCNTFNKTGNLNERIRLQLFPYSLKDGAARWLRSLPPTSIHTWADLVGKFLAKYYPLSKTREKIAEITNFF